MIRFIIRRFIKNSENVTDRDVRESYGVLSGVVGICCNLLLFSGKLAMGLLTGSIAVISDAFNNLTDLGSSTVTILGAKLSNRPPDKDHPHGHGRVEYISSLVVAMIIFFVGYQLLGDSYEKVVDPQPVTFHVGTLVVLVLAILVKLWMFSYNRYIGRRINSGVNRAAAIDSLSDCVATTGVIVSTVLAQFVDFPIDGLAGVAISLLILYSGFKIAKDTVDLLMGIAPAPENVARIDRIIRSGKHILGVHDLEVHDYGPSRVIASVHAEVPDNLNIVEAHASIDLLENRIAEELGIDIVIHLDPISTDEAKTAQVRAEIEACVAGMDPDVRIENFRIARLGERTVVIFELERTPRISDPDFKRVRKAFQDRIESCLPRYQVFIDRYGEPH